MNLLYNSTKINKTADDIYEEIFLSKPYTSYMFTVLNSRDQHVLYFSFRHLDEKFSMVTKPVDLLLNLDSNDKFTTRQLLSLISKVTKKCR